MGLRIAVALVVIVAAAVGGLRPPEGLAHDDCTLRGDFLHLGGTHYFAAYPADDAPLGPVVGTVRRSVGDRGDCAYEPADGDAAVLEVGTEVRTVPGYRSAFRVAARHPDGWVVVYQAWSSTVAKVGEDLLDIRGRVTTITYQPAGYCDDNGVCFGAPMPVEIADPAAIAAIVGTVLAAPVAPGRVRSDYAERAPHMYRLIYVLEDGTRAGNWVFGDLNQTDSGILLPSGFHGLVQRAATGAPLRVVEAYDVAFRSERVTIAAGIPVTIEVANTGALPHNFTVDGLGVSVDAAPGETGSATVTAPAGSYRFFCNVPGHKDAGMVGTLIAEAQPPATPEPQAE